MGSDPYSADVIGREYMLNRIALLEQEIKELQEKDQAYRCDFDCSGCHDGCETPGCVCGWDEGDEDGNEP